MLTEPDFEAVAKRCKRAGLAVASRFLRRDQQDDAEDCYQKALLSLWRHRNDEIANHEGYLMMAIRNVALVVSRDKTRHERSAAMVSLDAIKDADELFGAKPAQDAIFTCGELLCMADELKGAQRQAILEELGLVEESNSKTLKVRLCRARKNMMKIKQQRESVGKLKAMAAHG